MADPELFARRAAEGPGVPFVMAFPDKGRFPPAALGGRFRLPVGRGGRREGRGLHTLWRRAMLQPKGRILYDRAKGCLETQPKGTRLRSSGRCSGICQAAPRDYQAQSQLTSSAELRCAAAVRQAPAKPDEPGRPPTPVREPAARPHGGIHRAAPASGGGPVHEGAIPGRGRFPQNGPPPSDFNDRFEGSGGSEMVALRSPLPGLDGVLCFASRAASSTTRAKGCLET